MRSVYGNSFINIAASSATNVYGNLFSRTDHYSGGFCARVTMRKSCTVRKFHTPEGHKESTMWTHLATRAWTLQERLLPARTLFFGDSGVFWECRTGTRSEAFPEECSGIGGGHPVRTENQGWPWREIIDRYSGTNLTNPSDRLPALAGIARRQHEATGGRYLAGMWREKLVFQLPWYVFSERRKRPAWRAPSWSWMAVDGKVYAWQHMKSFREYISVLDAWTTPSGPDVFGQLSGGLLRIKCEALVRAEPLYLNRSKEILGPQRSARFQLVRVEAAGLHFPVSLDTLEEEWDCNEVCLLPVLSGPWGSRSHCERVRTDEEKEENVPEDLDEHWIVENQLILTGILLRSCGQSSDNEERFLRVGSFEFQNFSISIDEGYLGVKTTIMRSCESWIQHGLKRPKMRLPASH